jgi:hypothetical protein
MAESVYTKEWLADGRIACYRFVSTGTEAAETWYSDIVDLFSNWDRSKPLLLLIDVSRPDNMLSPEALRAARDASHVNSDVGGKTALVIDSSEPAQNVSGLVDHVLASTRERKIFSSEADAVAWLLES